MDSKVFSSLSPPSSIMHCIDYSVTITLKPWASDSNSHPTENSDALLSSQG